MIAETQGKKPEKLPPALEPQADLQKIAAFYRAMVEGGFKDSYEAAEARPHCN